MFFHAAATTLEVYETLVRRPTSCHLIVWRGSALDSRKISRENLLIKTILTLTLLDNTLERVV